MSKDFILYDSITGRILRCVQCHESMIGVQLQEENAAFIKGKANDEIQYIDAVTSEILNKTELPATVDKIEILANEEDIVIISNLPNPSIVKINEAEGYEVTDGSFEFTVDTPGEYSLLCSAFPYLDKEFIVNAS